MDENACPFEGCQFGKWTAREPVQLYSDWRAERKPLRRLAVGEVVEAVTGVHVTFAPAEIRVTAPIAQYGLKPGDTVFGYMNLGEGFFNAWFNGFWVEDFDGSGVSGLGCESGCNAKVMVEGRSEWWVRVKTSDGTIAWTNQAEKFDGTDALAGSLKPVFVRCRQSG
ncbi:MAG TPA: hypothetical protein VMH04_24015 [Candidatus Solibacter sp.]|nr:hypothetical protein [Candidatus Solibacter sp.]